MRWSIPLPPLLFLTAIAPAQPPDLPPPGPRGPGYIPQFEAPTPAQQYKELIPGLIEALKDSDAEVRQHSAMALAAIGPEAIRPLSDALKDPVKEKRAAAAYALGQMGALSRDAMPVLLGALKDEEAVVRRSASQAISRILSAETLNYARLTGAGMRPMGPRPGSLGPPTLPNPPATRPADIVPPKVETPKEPDKKKEPDK